MTIRLDVFDDARWTEQVAGRLTAFMESSPGTRLCLPTGDTPRPVYARIAQSVDFRRAEVFLLDEFCLPAGNAARCDEVFRTDLLSRLSVPPSALHSFDPETADSQAECARIERLIEDGGLDLTILGLGGNGHLGLNEPGTAANDPTRVVTLARSTKEAATGRYGSLVEPECGLTIGMRQILASREIWLLVTGSHKAEILERVLHGPIGPDVPASFLREHPNVVVLVDESAASLVR